MLPTTPAGAETELRTVAAQEQSPNAIDAKRRHDVANALTNVEVAAAMLVDDGVSAESRGAMVRILEAGVARLRILLLSDEDRAE